MPERLSVTAKVTRLAIQGSQAGRWRKLRLKSAEVEQGLDI